MTFTNDSRPSHVNISPLAQLTEEQIGNLWDAVEVFRDLDIIRSFEELDFTNHSFFSKGTNLHWYYATTCSSLNITIRLYRYEQEGAEFIRSSMNAASDMGRRFTHISNDNDTEIVLFHSFMSRGGHIWPTNRRILRTEVRIGNTIIILMESPDARRLQNNQSSYFLHLLSELLYKPGDGSPSHP